MLALKSSSTFELLRTRRPNKNLFYTKSGPQRLTHSKLDYLKFGTMRRDKQLSCKHLATSVLRVNYARERRIVCALQAAHELTREERDHTVPSRERVWRTLGVRLSCCSHYRLGERESQAEPRSKSVMSARTIPSASKITQRRFVVTSKSCASIRTTRSLIIIWVLPKE